MPMLSTMLFYNMQSVPSHLYPIVDAYWEFLYLAIAHVYCFETTSSSFRPQSNVLQLVLLAIKFALNIYGFSINMLLLQSRNS